MTDIHKRAQSHLTNDEGKRIGAVEVEIDAESIAQGFDADHLRATERVKRAVEAELLTIQDELDEEGEVL